VTRNVLKAAYETVILLLGDPPECVFQISGEQSQKPDARFLPRVAEPDSFHAQVFLRLDPDYIPSLLQGGDQPRRLMPVLARQPTDLELRHLARLTKEVEETPLFSRQIDALVAKDPHKLAGEAYVRIVKKSAGVLAARREDDPWPAAHSIALLRFCQRNDLLLPRYALSRPMVGENSVVVNNNLRMRRAGSDTQVGGCQ
jgi:hypothetical protein